MRKNDESEVENIMNGWVCLCTVTCVVLLHLDM